MSRKILTAKEGKILTNGNEVFGKTIYLAENADQTAFYEISEEEYAEKLEEQEGVLDENMY